MFCATWNVNGKKPQEDLSLWLVTEPSPDIYAIGYVSLLFSVFSFSFLVFFFFFSSSPLFASPPSFILNSFDFVVSSLLSSLSLSQRWMEWCVQRVVSTHHRCRRRHVWCRHHGRWCMYHTITFHQLRHTSQTAN